MVRPADPAKAVARMVELRGVQPGFPLYGTLDLRGGKPYRHALLRDHGALVRPELLTQLGVPKAIRSSIGDLPFTIRGVIEHEPGRRVGGFSLGPACCRLRGRRRSRACSRSAAARDTR